MQRTGKINILSTNTSNSVNQNTNPQIANLGTSAKTITWKSDLEKQNLNYSSIYSHTKKKTQGNCTNKFEVEDGKQSGTGIDLGKNIGEITDIKDIHESKNEDGQAKNIPKKNSSIINYNKPDEEEVTNFPPEENLKSSRDYLLNKAIIQFKYMLRFSRARFINKILGDMIKTSLADENENILSNITNELKEVEKWLELSRQFREKNQKMIYDNFAYINNDDSLNDEKAVEINYSLEKLEEYLYSVFNECMNFLKIEEKNKKEIKESLFKYNELFSKLKRFINNYQSLIMGIIEANDSGFDKDLPLITMSLKNLILSKGFWLDEFIKLFNDIPKIDEDHEALYVDQREAGFLIVENQENIKGIGTNNLQQCVAVIFDGLSKKNSTKRLISLAHVDVNTDIDSLDEVKNLFDTKKHLQIIVYQNNRVKDESELNQPQEEDKLDVIKKFNLEVVQKKMEKWKEEDSSIKICDGNWDRIFPNKEVKEKSEQIIYTPVLGGDYGDFELKEDIGAKIESKSSMMRKEKRTILDEARGIVCNDLEKSEKKYPLPLIDLSKIDNYKPEYYLENEEAKDILELFRISFDDRSNEKGIFTPWINNNLVFYAAETPSALEDLASKMQTRLILVRASLGKMGGQNVSNETSIAEIIEAFNLLQKDQIEHQQ